MRVLIVDDERPARDRLRRLLSQQADAIAIEEARDGIEALEKIAQWKPDAVFLDIQMPETNGLEVAASLPDPAPVVVFVTAYDKFALQAFDANATDYLLKPFDEQRFLRALQRVRERLENRAVAETFPAEAAPIERLLIADRGVVKVVPIVDILWIETADNYVLIHTANGEHLMRQTMTGLLPRLGSGFIRCHRRAAVRVGAIERVVTLDKGDSELMLTGGMRVPCSRQHRADVLDRLTAG
jgi:two-component system, LytTR family, response regulator